MDFSVWLVFIVGAILFDLIVGRAKRSRAGQQPAEPAGQDALPNLAHHDDEGTLDPAIERAKQRAQQHAQQQAQQRAKQRAEARRAQARQAALDQLATELERQRPRAAEAEPPMFEAESLETGPSAEERQRRPAPAPLRTVQPAVHTQQVRRHRLTLTPASARQAIVWSEILGRPVGLR